MGDWVFLKVSPWKKVLRFSRKGMLSPRFIGPYRILKCVGPAAYQLELPLDLNRIHDVLHVSMLRRYHSDPAHIFLTEEIEVRPDLTFEEKSVQILDCDVKILRKKSIPLVKEVEKQWNSKANGRLECLKGSGGLVGSRILSLSIRGTGHLGLVLQ
ncbi:uncharacterized protein [Gossypium hirsutum]|uniref:Tf2-1-like SH3-like domain-containing protein n=1 Tax=Gossypium hirsutum TaxID=3635 RepID=A0A1U8NFN1_GOSHI|nr:uncharacterized protein LOC107947845 [Gossypium hirsutum]